MPKTATRTRSVPTVTGPPTDGLTTRQRNLYRAVVDAAPDLERQLMMVGVHGLRHGASLADMRVVREALKSGR